MFDKNRLKKLAELKLAKKEHEAALKELKIDIEAAEADLLAMLEETGLDSVKADGYTFSIARKLTGSLASGSESVRALIKSDMIECTMVGYQRTNSVIREYINSKMEDNPLLDINEAKEMFEDDNPELKGMVRVYEKYGISMRKS